MSRSSAGYKKTWSDVIEITLGCLFNVAPNYKEFIRINFRFTKKLVSKTETNICPRDEKYIFGLRSLDDETKLCWPMNQIVTKFDFLLILLI